MSDLPLLVGAALLADAAVAWLVLRRGPLDLPRLLFAASCGALLVLAQGGLAAVLLGRSFLAIRLAHAWLFLFLPAACAAVLLLARRRGATPPARAAAVTGALALPALFAWTSLIEPFDLRLETTEVVLPASRALAAPLRIGVLSDLQCEEIGSHERAAVALLMEQRPDLILIPGDLYQVFSVEDSQRLAGPLHALLAELDAPLGVFAVRGNCDGGDGLRLLFRGTRVRLLDDEIVRLDVDGRVLALCGLDLSVRSDAARQTLEQLAAGPASDLRIVFAHVPDAALVLPPGPAPDLVVAGHTHGGQVQLPWYGPPFTLSQVPIRVAAGGLHELNGTRIYVSRGIGVERGDAPRIRFNCPPEVSLLTLR